MEGLRTPEELKIVRWLKKDAGHIVGPEAEVVNFEDLKDYALEEGEPDAIGLGEGEETPFSAQQGEHP